MLNRGVDRTPGPSAGSGPRQWDPQTLKNVSVPEKQAAYQSLLVSQDMKNSWGWHEEYYRASIITP